QQSRALFDRHNAGLWGAWSLDSNALIGFVGLWPFRDTTVLELVYGVAEHSWGTGCAGEIAAAVMEYCFASLGMTVIRASTDVPNARSIRVLEKLGFAQVNRSQVAGLDTVFFERASP